jgi:hypothetical protein
MIKRSLKSRIKERIKNYFYSQSDQDLILNYNQNSCFPPGHFYSPIVNIENIAANEDKIWPANPVTPESVDMNVGKQLEMLNDFGKYYNDFPYLASNNKLLRYTLINKFFDPLDALVLYSFLRYFSPGNIIEVGSGFSSSIMLDTIDIFENISTELIFIEPYPDRLKSLLHTGDQKFTTIIEKGLQDIPVGVFQSLRANDILFIDSTHVCKTGSDLNFLFFHILPSLNKGVIIHFHDIFNGFEYPKNWVMEGRNWNEIYILEAFLMYNKSFKILFFNDFLYANYKEKLMSEFPFPDLTSGGSLYLIKSL